MLERGSKDLNNPSQSKTQIRNETRKASVTEKNIKQQYGQKHMSVRVPK